MPDILPALSGSAHTDDVAGGWGLRVAVLPIGLQLLLGHAKTSGGLSVGDDLILNSDAGTVRVIVVEIMPHQAQEANYRLQAASKRELLTMISKATKVSVSMPVGRAIPFTIAGGEQALQMIQDCKGR